MKTKSLKPNNYELLSCFASKFNMCRYAAGPTPLTDENFDTAIASCLDASPVSGRLVQLDPTSLPYQTLIENAQS